MAPTSLSSSDSKTAPGTDRVAFLVGRWKNWHEQLKQYWEQMDKNQEMYEFYRREAVENEFDDLSLNTPFAIVESMVAKGNDTTLAVTVQAKGENLLGPFEDWVSAVLKGAIEDPDIARFHGSFRKIREMYFREFLVKGNAVAEVNWCYEKGTMNGEERVLADNPYTRVLPLKSVTFNPTRTISTSNVYYLETSVSFDELKEKKYDSKNGKGIYKNLDQVKKNAQESGKMVDALDDQFISGNRKINRKLEPIHLLQVWEGSHYTVIADQSTIIREEEDPLGIGGHNLLIAMNYAVEGRPYAYGEIDGIYKPTRVQDTLVNQKIEVLNRYLKPGFLLEDDSINPDEFILLLENGGVLPGRGASITPVSQHLPVPPPAAFSQVQELQQAVEKTARFSLYSAGVTSSATDQTQGTLGGIARLQAAAEPNFQIKLDTIQDSFMRPLANTYLTMIANHMGKSEVRYGLLQNQKKGWIKVTKGILQGKTSINELVTAGIISQEVADSYTHGLIPSTDPYGNPVKVIGEIPGAAKADVFDVDWVISVRLDNQSATDKQEEVNRKANLIQMGMKMGVQFDAAKVIERLGEEMGFDDISDLIISGTPPMDPAMAAQAGGMPPQMPGAAPMGAQPPPDLSQTSPLAQPSPYG